MQREGLLSMHVEHQEDRPNRKVYEITDEGREEFEGWMRQATDLPSLKDAFLIKLFFGGATDRATIAEGRVHLETLLGIAHSDATGRRKRRDRDHTRVRRADRRAGALPCRRQPLRGPVDPPAAA